MMSQHNPIAERIAQFLKEFPPYQFLDEPTLKDLCNKMQIRHQAENSLIFKSNESPKPYIFTVFKGTVNLFNPENEAFADVAEQGDTFGVRAMLSGKNYIFTAQCVQESLILEIPIQTFKKLTEHNPQIMQWFASGLASGTILLKNQIREISAQFSGKNQGIAADFQRSPVEVKEVFTLPETAILKEAAALMMNHNIGSILVKNSSEKLVGIITDKDLRKALATLEKPALQSINTLMSSPVICEKPSATWFDIYLKMLTHKIRHLAITDTGNAEGKLVSLVTEHDLLKTNTDSPVGLVKRIKHAKTLSELITLRNHAENTIKSFIEQKITAFQTAQISAGINQTLIQQLITLNLNILKLSGEPKRETNFCWLQLGSEAREEQALRTDQDNALIFNDEPEAKAFYLALAQKVCDDLNACGFDYCPAEVMASNPALCLSLNDWKQKFSKWIAVPEPKALMNTTIFFDFKPVYGNVKLAEELEAFILNEIKLNKRFLSHLALNAQQNPSPFGLLKGLNVETSGTHKNDFDIKARGLMPITDAARVLAYSFGLVHKKSTKERFLALSEIDTNNTETYLDAIESFEILLKFRFNSAALNGSTGRYIKKEQLSPLERGILKKALQCIKNLQEILSVKFQTQFLG
jgi:CBS domain-containing protein